MSDKAQTIRLREIYCPHCHLATRADTVRCIHCRKPISGSPEERDPQATKNDQWTDWPRRWRPADKEVL